MATIRKGMGPNNSGQALVELAMIVPVLAVLVFGIIDFGRALYYVEVIKNLTGEGSSMSSRGTSLPLTVQTVVSDAGSDLQLATLGCVIATSVTNTGAQKNPMQVTGQSTQGACTGISSKIGCYPPPSTCGNASLPSEAAAALQVNQSLYITEIFYTYSTVTPLGTLLKNANVLPTTLYDVAYY